MSCHCTLQQRSTIFEVTAVLEPYVQACLAPNSHDATAPSTLHAACSLCIWWCIVCLQPLQRGGFSATSTSVHSVQSSKEVRLSRRYSTPVKDYDKAFEAAKTAIVDKFYGPPTKGVFSPSVQYTLHEMAKEILAK